MNHLSALCRSKEGDIVQLEEQRDELSEAISLHQVINSQLYPPPRAYKVTVLEQDSNDTKTNEIARLKQEIKRLSYLNTNTEARLREGESHPSRNMSSGDLVSLRQRMDMKKRTLEQLHVQAQTTSRELTSSISELRQESETLTRAIKEAESTVNKMSGLAASQTVELKRLQQRLQEEREIQSAAKAHLEPKTPLRVSSWSPRYRVVGNPALQRISSFTQQVGYFPTILRNLRGASKVS